MIEKLTPIRCYDDKSNVLAEGAPDAWELMEKINEIIDFLQGETVKGKVNQDGILELNNGESIDINPSLNKCAFGLQSGAEVRIIIIKAEGV